MKENTFMESTNNPIHLLQRQLPTTHDLILDPHIITAISEVTAPEIVVSFSKLYPDVDQLEESEMKDVESWLAKARRVPGTALSTGRRNSLRGMFTCCLLEVLKVPLPKTARTRMTMAWAILNSEKGMTLIGVVPELDVARAVETTQQTIEGSWGNQTHVCLPTFGALASTHLKG